MKSSRVSKLDLFGDRLLSVVFLSELHVPQVLGVTTLVPDAELGIGLPGGVPVSLAALVVVGVILRLGHFRLCCKKKGKVDNLC